MKLSIITVCYNNKEGLQKTIDSVRDQTFKDYEFVVIDGGSKDGSKEIIETNKELFSFWCSEPDGGIYQGMNKGIEHATGEYCLFLNSGDWLAYKEVLKDVFKCDFCEDILYGDVIRSKGRMKRFIKYPKELSFADFYKTSAALHHQATFFKTTLFEKFGKYAENSYMNADWRFYFKTIVVNNVSYKHVGCLISVCDANGTSSSYSFDNPKVLSDIKFKQDAINAVIPVIAKNDFEKLCKVSKFKHFITSFLFRVSIIIPISVFIKLYK